ncbi:hypothetical protein C8J56DRAFT_921804 [Mycena floridula]|nr:hypothetical protein C8J56DRAFT_921804 [Mycena floridula]
MVTLDRIMAAESVSASQTSSQSSAAALTTAQPSSNLFHGHRSHTPIIIGSLLGALCVLTFLAYLARRWFRRSRPPPSTLFIGDDCGYNPSSGIYFASNPSVNDLKLKPPKGNLKTANDLSVNLAPLKRESSSIPSSYPPGRASGDGGRSSRISDRPSIAELPSAVTVVDHFVHADSACRDTGETKVQLGSNSSASKSMISLHGK